jgi:signal transduction histidine kinase
VEDDNVIVSVTDEGIGISEEDQQHLFSSFFRGANATNIQGTGLGLHIVKSYIDLLGGDVGLKSTLNTGTTITFTIPVNLPETE